MGFLEAGTPLSWEDSKEFIPYVATHGIEQLLHIWKMNKDREDVSNCWGDEIEYNLVSIDSENERSRIYVNVSEIIEELQLRERLRSKGTVAHLLSEWHPEFGNHMIEALPSPPYLLTLNSLLLLEPSMRLRRGKIQSVLPYRKYVTSQTTFPRMGLQDFVDASCLSYEAWSVPDTPYEYKVTESVFVPDSVINPHPRFPTLLRNTQARRKSKMFIAIPVYKDTFSGCTPRERVVKYQALKNHSIKRTNVVSSDLGVCSCNVSSDRRDIGKDDIANSEVAHHEPSNHDVGKDNTTKQAIGNEHSIRYDKTLGYTTDGHEVGTAAWSLPCETTLEAWRVEDTRWLRSKTYREESTWALSLLEEELTRFEVEQLAKKTMNPVRDHIYMDCMAFGMGMGCAQITFACSNMSSARYLYDQLVTLSPLFLALSASTPYHRGLLSAYDTRWSALEQSVDCRTREETLGGVLGSEKAAFTSREDSEAFADPENARFGRMPKSRYSAVSRYIANDPYVLRFQHQLNDTPTPLCEVTLNTLTNQGMDHMLAMHYAYLWTRDPLIIFKEKVFLDDTTCVDHFENIQSTNWHSVRFKPPPMSNGVPGPINWRVELRTPDVQLTDYDNAAAVALASVLVQAILHYKLNLYIPMSLNDINMQRSWKNDALRDEKFFIRTNVFDHTNAPIVAELSLHDILAGNAHHQFIGFIPLCEQYMNDTATKATPTTQTAQDSPNKGPCDSSDKNLSAAIPSDKNITTPNSSDKNIITPNSSEQSLTTLNSSEHVTNSPSVQSPWDAMFTQSAQMGASPERYGHAARACFAQYASLFLERTKGNLLSCAQFLRRFVLCHPCYRRDSMISPKISHDLTTLTTLLGFGIWACPQLHGEFASQHLILQTPLPATVELPRLSEEALLMIEFVPADAPPSPHTHPLKFRIYEKPLISLNAIDSIYTMPLGVTTRSGQVYKHSKEAGKTALDLYSLTLEVLQTAARPSSPEKKARVPRNVFSSEEFTQAWILKGFDCLGCNDYEYRKLCDERSDRISTLCPSSMEDIDDSDMGDENQIHELSRSFNLGFGNEQELEYFQQVCGSSA